MSLVLIRKDSCEIFHKTHVHTEKKKRKPYIIIFCYSSAITNMLKPSGLKQSPGVSESAGSWLIQAGLSRALLPLPFRSSCALGVAHIPETRGSEETLFLSWRWQKHRGIRLTTYGYFTVLFVSLLIVSY